MNLKEVKTDKYLEITGDNESQRFIESKLALERAKFEDDLYMTTTTSSTTTTTTHRPDNQQGYSGHIGISGMSGPAAVEGISGKSGPVAVAGIQGYSGYRKSESPSITKETTTAYKEILQKTIPYKVDYHKGRKSLLERILEYFKNKFGSYN